MNNYDEAIKLQQAAGFPVRPSQIEKIGWWLDERDTQRDEDLSKGIGHWLWKYAANNGEMVGDYDDQEKHWTRQGRIVIKAAREKKGEQP